MRRLNLDGCSTRWGFASSFAGSEQGESRKPFRYPRHNAGLTFSEVVAEAVEDQQLDRGRDERDSSLHLLG